METVCNYYSFQVICKSMPGISFRSHYFHGIYKNQLGWTNFM